jgi:hypothetical protein
VSALQARTVKIEENERLVTVILVSHYMESDPSQISSENRRCQMVHLHAICAICDAPAIGMTFFSF